MLDINFLLYIYILVSIIKLYLYSFVDSWNWHDQSDSHPRDASRKDHPWELPRNSRLWDALKKGHPEERAIFSRDSRPSRNPRSVVLNLGSIEPQGFGETVSGVRQQEILSNESKKNKFMTHFIFPITKGSMNAFIEFFGFSTSNKVKNHCPRQMPPITLPVSKLGR